MNAITLWYLSFFFQSNHWKRWCNFTVPVWTICSFSTNSQNIKNDVAILTSVCNPWPRPLLYIMKPSGLIKPPSPLYLYFQSVVSSRWKWRSTAIQIYRHTYSSNIQVNLTFQRLCISSMVILQLVSVFDLGLYTVHYCQLQNVFINMK